ncbi:hypothetical protein HPB49_000579 [Dermacentor silvarum]|uniref:Uncharacterized protein n=1 Tax=Dermacentor silvarum TaxID=543639 RepID=A0ACB8DSJ3_DERSI|nr:hypothetical protein HPB49_000579 [Dermacentor silvarum]
MSRPQSEQKRDKKRKNAPQNCYSERPVISIPANDSFHDNAEDTTSFVFPVLLDVTAEPPLANRTRLALDYPPECIPEVPKGVVVQVSAPAMASGWTGSRRLVFRLRARSYVASIKTPLLNGTTLRVTLWANESHGLPCSPNQASASLILNFPVCRQKPVPRFKRSVHKPRSRLSSTDAGPSEERHLAQAGVNPNGCQVVSLVVDIWSLGWRRWVLAPHSFSANKCFGKCRFPAIQLLNSTNHSTLLSLASGVRWNPTNYQVCCVPIRYESQSVLYFDDYGHVVLKAFDNMRVSACGCR